MPDKDEWTPERIKLLRKSLGMSQADFGQEIWDASPATAQKNVSRLETGEVSTSAAVRRALQRMDKALRESTLPPFELRLKMEEREDAEVEGAPLLRYMLTLEGSEYDE
ncbi:transcriptional regulator with XRE-family HTH domain [Salinibacter ruber]|uniref:helix-turn-helix domain-containing protein n=1 Tax=Salinibacter ruber TaxID=146919 RepID=UPI0021699B1A|nr:hypothetical protein [Salinibacter ruber]MCS4087283.1 transcriptional regulator with XRE-family HTH domain [Salinibacter ruber]